MSVDADRPLIVVGVDGSESSRAALRWAAGHAQLTGAVVRAVMVWTLPEVHAGPSRDYEADARDTLTAEVEQALGSDPSIQLVTRVVQGRAGPTLTEESAGAQLLVVGSHGHGAHAGMPLGSVSHYCVSHARCPVVVVPPGQP